MRSFFRRQAGIEHVAVNDSHFSAAATILADHPISPYGDFYFEVEIENQGSNQYVIINPIPSHPFA